MEADIDEEIGDPHFWCAHHKFIFYDVYDRLKIRPMHPIDLTKAGCMPQCAEALAVTNKMWLHHLIELQCSYDTSMVKQFYSTLVVWG